MKKLTITFMFSCFFLIAFSQDTTVSVCGNKSSSQDLLSILKNWQTLIAAIIVMIGWFVNSKLNRNAEIAKRRAEHRLSALKSVVESVIFEMSKGTDKFFAQKDHIGKLEKARATIQMYGYRHEIDIYEEFVKALNIDAKSDEELANKLKKVNECIPKLSIIIESLRTELGLEIYKKTKR